MEPKIRFTVTGRQSMLDAKPESLKDGSQAPGLRIEIITCLMIPLRGLVGLLCLVF